MGSDVKSLPIIDIAPLLEKCDDPKMAEDEEVLKVVRQLDEASKEIGFFYVKGHGIPDSLIKEARDVTQEFFALPTEEKHKIRLSSTTGYRPDTPSNFKSVLEQYTSLLKEFGRKIMRGLALALGAPADAFEGEIAGDAFWLHRLIGYPSLSDTRSAEMKCNDFGCAAHTDIGSLVTYLNQTEDIHALQPTFHKLVEPFAFCVQKTGGVAKYEGSIRGKTLGDHVVKNLIHRESG